MTGAESGEEIQQDTIDWWECAECGETGNSGVRCCPECDSMQIGTYDGGVDLPPCWKEDHGDAAASGCARLFLHLDGPGFIGVKHSGEAELVRAEIQAGEEPDPKVRPATPENIRDLAETYNDEWYGDSLNASGANA